MIVAQGLNFGGPAILPQGRVDTLNIINDTMTHMTARQSLRLGGEYRRFLNDNFAEGTGMFDFPSVAAFMAGSANAFSITLGERRSRILQDAVAFFVQDRIALRPNLSLDVGLRYEWHVTPTERDNQFVVFDASTASLVRVGVDVDEIYQQNNTNVEPRLGVAWTPFANGRTVVRAAYGVAVDQPSTTVVRDTPANPPFAVPLAASGSIRLADALTTTQPIGLSPVTVDPRFRNASLRSWNVNIQRELGLARGGDGGVHRLARPRPPDFAQSESAGGRRAPVSSGFALQPDPPRRPAGQRHPGGEQRFLQLPRAVALGDETAVSRPVAGCVVHVVEIARYQFAQLVRLRRPERVRHSQCGYGLSDFDARHRFVLSVTYALPFEGHPLTRGWQLAAIVQSQSGNPVNIVTSNSTLNGTPNSVRPDLIGPIRIIGSVDQWFDPTAFMAVNRFGTLGRNVVIGPSFHNTDFSIIKSVTISQRYRLQLRADVFNLFNHPNFGPPGNVVGSPTFGKISRTRLPTGEAGSSRQIQLAMKLSF